MREQYVKWFSPALGTDIEMLVFGESGIPILAFPTSMGRYYQNKDFKLIESAKWYVENGKFRIYCIDGIDEISWYNKQVEPYIRAYNHTCYDAMLYGELAPMILQECGVQRLVTAGCSFGGYHAANFTFKHPECVSHMIAMGAAFDIRDRVAGYYDDNVYFNNPPDYLPDNDNEALRSVQVFLGTTETDMCKSANMDMSYILDRKGVPHWLDIRAHGGHDWPVWREMFPHYLSMIG